MSGSALEGAVIDLDGTVYRGNRLVDGAREGIGKLREAGLGPVFLTNNPIEERSVYRDRLRALGTTPERCLVVGDRLETDVKMGLAAGMTTALVLSGVTDRDAVSASTIEPDHVLESLGEIGSVLHS